MIRASLLTLTFLARIAPACAHAAISQLPQLAVPTAADLFVVEYVRAAVEQRTSTITAQNLAG